MAAGFVRCTRSSLRTRSGQVAEEDGLCQSEPLSIDQSESKNPPGGTYQCREPRAIQSAGSAGRRVRVRIGGSERRGGGDWAVSFEGRFGARR